jgi:ATP-binding cassette subfamily B protein
MIGVAYFMVIPILGSATFQIGKKLKTVQKSIVKETAELSGSATETLRNVELVKSLGLEGQEVGRLNGIIEKILNLELGKVRIVRALSFTQGTLINAMRTAIMFLMLYLIFQQEITLGEFFSLLFYSFALFNPLDALASVSTAYQETRASMNAIQQLLDQKPDAPPAHATVFNTISSISFRNVGFSYEDSSRVLRDVSLSISSGETVALVGPSGGGKSTILKLLVGLYKPTEGAIFINGIENTAIDYEQFRRRIGYVAQDTQLFAGTIRENLQFVRPEATDAQCLDVLAKASALSIIEKNDEGLSAKIGEGGLKLSGGQRQRLAIARALLRDPELIIFDEATSSLDSLTEQEITDTIKQLRVLRPDMMMIMIAHRLSTIAHADRIYVLEKGSIIEEGSADSLISAGGLFGAMWRQQNPR